MWRMNNLLKLFSLNIEEAKHYDRWVPFVQEKGFDVVCLQEVCKSDLHIFEERLDMKFIFTPMCNIFRSDNGERDVCGVAIGSKLAPESNDSISYVKEYHSETEPDSPKGFMWPARVLLSVTYKKDGEPFHISTTHFTKTPDGEITDYQRKDANALLSILQAKGDFVLCGDMNAPRGKECFGMFAEHYHDNIPAHYKSSLDMEIRSHPFEGDSNLMVDCLFSTPHYRTENVELVSGLSDHMGIVTDIYKS